MGTDLRLIGEGWLQDISGWDNPGRTVLSIMGHHASNGLSKSRGKRVKRMVNDWR